MRDVAPSILVAFLLLLPGALDVAGPYLDAAVYSEVGTAIRDGGVVYMDVWDHKPPGIYVVDALSQAAMPFVSPWIATWVASLVFAAATLLLLGMVLPTDAAGRRIGLALCAAAAVLTLYPVAVGGGLAEVPALAFAMAAFVLVSRQGARSGRVLLAGGLAGWACVVSPQAASAALAVLYLAADGGSPSNRVRAIGVLALGAAIVSACTVLWLWSIGALPAAVDAVVTYNRAYVEINRQSVGPRLISPIVLSLGCLACLLLPAVFSRMGLANAGIPQSRLTTAAQIWLVGVVLVIAAQGRISPHYVLLAVPPLAILGAPVFDEAFQETRRTLRRRAFLTVLGGIVVTAVVGSFVTQRYLTRSPNRDQVTTVGAWLRTNTPADASVFTWGNQPYIHDIADRPPASKYVYMLPLTTPGYSSTEQVAKLVDHLEAEPPHAIIDAGSAAPGEPGWLPLLIPRTVVRVDGRELDLLDPLREFVLDHYHLAEVVDGWPVYLRD